jgi:DNA modification methylase
VKPYYADQALTLYRGHALDVVSSLPAESVDCIVTSPPYFGQRAYLPEGHPDKPYEIGCEESPAEYVGKLRALFSEVRRVLADDGVLWLNAGDSYSGRSNGAIGHRAGSRDRAARPAGRIGDIPPKNLLGIPWRIAFALQDDGWILRQEIVWSKRNCLPEAVTDRPSRTHEQVFLFTKSPRYWYDADAIREAADPEQTAHNERYAKVYEVQASRAKTTGQPGNQNSAGIHSRPGKPGRNARSVWDINTTPFPGAHFATFPPELPRRCILAGCKPGGTVLDPFSGSGTTGMVAAQLGRRYVGIDLFQKYLDDSLNNRLGQTALLDGESA